MPLQTCNCINPSCSEYNITKERILKSSEVPYCEVCNHFLIILFPSFLHVKSSSREIDGRDLGKVTKEKNEALKKKHSGYSYEEQNLRKKVEKQTEEIRKSKEKR